MIERFISNIITGHYIYIHAWLYIVYSENCCTLNGEFLPWLRVTMVTVLHCTPSRLKKNLK